MIGPFRTLNNGLVIKSSSLFEETTVPLVASTVREPDVLRERSMQSARFRLFDALSTACGQVMLARDATLIDLPVLTRMISSPGALNGRIITDVEPFLVPFFGYDTFLTQSSQLYLEAALAISDLDEVYCLMKSFRRELTDFRHLPEFQHVEYEANVGFLENISIQVDFLFDILSWLLDNAEGDLLRFLCRDELNALATFTSERAWEMIRLDDALRLLHADTGLEKYAAATPTCIHFTAWEEVRLTEIVPDRLLFVTHYPSEEVAFYHQNCPLDSRFAVNADLIFPGYGELIGSGERVRTRHETAEKAAHFELNPEDYSFYIETREWSGERLHSGWGMGLERFLQAVLKVPHIAWVKAFPRVHNSVHP